MVALVQLTRIQRRVPENGWTTQKVFHLLNAFVCILRCVVFALRDKVCPAEAAAVVGAVRTPFGCQQWQSWQHAGVGWSAWVFIIVRVSTHSWHVSTYRTQSLAC